MEEYEAMSTCSQFYSILNQKIEQSHRKDREERPKRKIPKLTSPSHRQSSLIPKNLLRLGRQNRPLAQHNRPQDLPAILVLQDPRLRPAAGLVPLLRRMDPFLPARSDRTRQYSGLEQCVRDHDCGCGRDSWGCNCAGPGTEATAEAEARSRCCWTRIKLEAGGTRLGWRWRRRSE